jgi:catechol 2,3-dioxygenase-like lactoylglutathione lyase family enzyme
MSTTEDRNDGAGAGQVDMKLEVVIIPVSDVERSKQIYERLGWRLDADFARETTFASSSSRLQAPGARSGSAPESQLPRPARPRAWS